jgi:HAE1 family hydrophobic/amphiphilic exporter-1
VIGGLIASTALSLFVVPVLYTLMDDFEHKIRRLLGRGAKHVEKPKAVAAPEAAH